MNKNNDQDTQRRRQLIIAKLFALPHFIVSFSKPNQDMKKEKFFKSLIASAVFIRPSAFHAYHIPITITGLNSLINTLMPIKIYVITSHDILTQIFERYFKVNKNLPNLSVSCYSTLPNLSEFYPNWRIDPKMLSDNVIWVFYCSTWSDIVASFAQYNILVTGGVNAKRHILSPNQYKFVMLLNALGFHYKDIAYYYNSLDKDMIQTKTNFQNILLQEKSAWSENLDHAGNVLFGNKDTQNKPELTESNQSSSAPQPESVTDNKEIASSPDFATISSHASSDNLDENVNKEFQDYEKTTPAKNPVE